VEYGPGVMAPNEPTQEKISSPEPFPFKDHTITPLATFDIEAKVLSKERYRYGRGADLSPVDLALGWGRMSDETVLKDIEITQSSRWYHWRTSAFPIPKREISSHSANMHMVPATEEVKEALLSVHQGDIVHIRGYLIRADKSDGSYWVSSLSRNDTGAHACELVYVESVEK